ncbi:hypothetical protein M9979_12570 [Sphingomonas sp. RP10(2022)]|uniref:Uncharacterized protein n=1 Tax=Sphingomonas liriopis TaxID=2949094 RepID=A0A9X2HY79_9SPHN|nr:hypothetical protein [Sphingomonas liriopis]MCP3735708.1 hypothetical protein [Sphingomonas liriopis]
MKTINEANIAMQEAGKIGIARAKAAQTASAPGVAFQPEVEIRGLKCRSEERVQVCSFEMRLIEFGGATGDWAMVERRYRRTITGSWVERS